VTPARPRRRTWAIVSAAVFVLAAGVLTAGLLSGGCPTRPKAPPLTNSAVYQNDRIGLRFLVPEGWSIASRMDPPAGTLPKPLILVSYAYGQADHPGGLELLAAELPDDADVGRFLADNPIGPQKWRPAGRPEPLTINDEPATRYTMSAPSGTGRGESRREATAFRRGGRVYVFLATFGATDASARDTVRRSVESVTWTR
jgi:hypothetical protein